MTTSNVNNTGIAHLSFRVGGQPFCKSRRGHVCVTPDNQLNYQICKRCAKQFAKMQERKNKSEIKTPSWCA